jgi:hypothetical protein
MIVQTSSKYNISAPIPMPRTSQDMVKAPLEGGAALRLKSTEATDYR